MPLQVGIAGATHYLDLYKLFSLTQVATMAGVTLYLLAKNPEVQGKLQEELDKVLGSNGTEPLTQRHLDQLSYLKAVVKEANR